MQEQESAEAWKKIDEIECDLSSSYMDHEDKWKKALGANLYKQTNLNVDGGQRQRIS